jgi:hypothetical protein
MAPVKTNGTFIMLENCMENDKGFRVRFVLPIVDEAYLSGWANQRQHLL